MPKEFAHLDAKRRREKPTAIGRMPPVFFVHGQEASAKEDWGHLWRAAFWQDQIDKSRQRSEEIVTWFLAHHRVAYMLWAQKIRAPSRAGWKRENCPTDFWFIDQQTVVLLRGRQIAGFSRGWGVFLSAWKEKHQKGRLGSLPISECLRLPWRCRLRVWLPLPGWLCVDCSVGHER